MKRHESSLQVLLLYLLVPCVYATSVIELIQNTSNLATFWSMIDTSGVQDSLKPPSVVTVFAPGNAGLAMVGNDYVNELLTVAGFQQHLATFVLHHITDQAFEIFNLTDGQKIAMRDGETVESMKRQGVVTLKYGPTDERGSALVTNSDTSLSNGVVHTINTPLLPSFYYTSLLDPGGSFFKQLAATAGLSVALRQGRFTLFLPTADAFVSLPSNVLNDTEVLGTLLRLHMVRGVLPSSSLENGTLLTVSGEELHVVRSDDGFLTINGLSVVETNVLARNGIVHRVNGILTSQTLSPTMSPTIISPSLADAIASDPELSTLGIAVELSGLNDTLKNQTTQWTFFAPVRTAFQNLDSDLVKTIFQPEWISHLRSIVSMHVYTGSALDSNALTMYNNKNLSMLNEEVAGIQTGSSGTVFITGPDGVSGTVSVADVEARNGVLHKIDTVLLPSFVTNDLFDVLESSGNSGGENFTEFVNLIRAADLEGTLRSGVFTILAPTNDAILTMGLSQLKELQDPTNFAEVTELVRYHMIPQILPSPLLQTTSSFQSDSGRIVESAACDCGIGHRFNNVPVEKEDILARNGIIHALGGVLTTSYNATAAPSQRASIPPGAPTTAAPSASTPTSAAMPSVNSNPTVPTIEEPTSHGRRDVVRTILLSLVVSTTGFLCIL